MPWVARIHVDLLPFISKATPEEIGEFIKAQVAQSAGREIGDLSPMAEALLIAHNNIVALINCEGDE